MAAPKRIDELTAGTSLSAGAAVAVVQDGGTFRFPASAFITQAESFTPSGSGASAESVQTVLRNIGKMVTSFGAVGDDSSDDTAEVQACADTLTSGGVLIFPHGKTFKLTDVITLLSNVTVLNFGTIKQYTTDKGVFKATQKDRVHIVNYGLISGPGVWSSGWTGNTGHEERGVQFLGCTRSSVTGPGIIRNFGHAQVATLGGTNIKVHHTLEGTNGYGSSLTSGDNFQMCVYVADDATYGNAIEIDINCDISGSAQGVLYEHPSSTTDNGGSLRLRGHIHDIPGQHACYLQNGNCDVDITVDTIALSACKISSPLNGQNIKGFKAHVCGNGVLSNLFEVEAAGTGSVSTLNLIGSADTVGRGLSVSTGSGSADNLHADIVVSNVSTNALNLQGAAQTDFNIKITGDTVDSHGISITATTSSNIKIWPTIRNPNNANSSNTYGILVASASATVDLFYPDVTDSNTRMVYGLFNSTAGGVVRVHGAATFTGASDTAVRATGKITEWPTNTTLSATNGEFTSPQNITSSQPMVFHVQTTSASNVDKVLITLDDESAYIIRAEIVGKLSGSAQRACYIATRLAYRDGGGSTLEGAEDVDVSIASGSFAGAYSWLANTNEIYIRLNSGGVATYDWTVTWTIRKVV